MDKKHSVTKFIISEVRKRSPTFPVSEDILDIQACFESSTDDCGLQMRIFENSFDSLNELLIQLIDIPFQTELNKNDERHHVYASKETRSFTHLIEKNPSLVELTLINNGVDDDVISEPLAEYLVEILEQVTIESTKVWAPSSFLSDD